MTVPRECGINPDGSGPQQGTIGRRNLLASGAQSVRRTGDRLRTIVCTVKNEGPFFLEWLAYHRLIGFNRFVIFSNDCTDGTHEILQALDGAGLIHHFDNSELSTDLPEDPQVRAYTRANRMEIVRESDWIMVIDGDEFLQVKVGDGTLDALFAAMPDNADAIGLPWRIFGSGGVIEFSDRLQIDTFRRAAPLDFAPSPNHLAIKTLFRPDLVQRFGVHRPVYKGTSGTPRNPLLFVNGSGQDVTEHFLRGRWCMPPALAGFDLAQVNHYMIRSHEVFLMKKWRGTANSANAQRINFEYFDKYNSNHDVDRGMLRWVPAVTQEIARLTAALPELTALGRSAFDLYAGQIAELKSRLLRESPQEHDRLFDPEVVQAEIEAQERRIAKLRATVPAADRVRMMPPERPSQAAPAPQAGKDDAAARAPGGDDAAPPPAPAAPGWLLELRGDPARRGFFQSFEQTGLHYVQRDTDQLVISFDNLSAVNIDPVDRESWGYGFIRKNGWSHLGVFAYAAKWFREDALFDYLSGLARDGFFARFRSVALIGTSMGAYAATALAPLAPGCTVVAFSPQSTLKKALVPWEKRFSSGRKADWSGDFADGAEGARAAGKLWLVYDPRIEEDRLHIERYQGENVSFLKARYAGHKTALFLRRAGLLSTVVREAVTGTLTESRFYDLYRQSRSMPWYLNSTANRIAESAHPRRLQRLDAYLKKVEKPQISRNLHARFPEIMSSA